MKLILLDVDGVLTNGRVTLDAQGNEFKTICYRDLDAIGIGRVAGYEFAFVTGEDTKMVEVLANRFAVKIVYSGAKDKLMVVNQVSQKYGIPLENLMYVGDSDRDAPALKSVGLSVAPKDASDKALAAAQHIAESNGGEGVLHEVVSKLLDGEIVFP